MTKLLDETIAKVRKLPAEEQDAAAGALMDYLDSARHLRLSDEQLAEVRHRLAVRREPSLGLSEVRERLLRDRR